MKLIADMVEEVMWEHEKMIDHVARVKAMLAMAKL